MAVVRRIRGPVVAAHWLYTIATSACLTALQHRSRRPLASGLGPHSADPYGELEKVAQTQDGVIEPPDSDVRAVLGR